MKIHYYLDWFYDEGFSESLVCELQKDIVDRNSIVFISAEPIGERVEAANQQEAYEKKWFDQVGIFFDEYYFIHHDTPKEQAQQFIKGASVIFLRGGYPQDQMQLMIKLELQDLIKKSSSVVMGTSAGGMNMSRAYVDDGKVYPGLALGDFSFEAHFDYADITQVKERFSLSSEMNIYVAANKRGAVLVGGSDLSIVGDVYLVSHSQIHQLAQKKFVKD